ncbi:transposase [Roseovarius sp. MBR-51]
MALTDALGNLTDIRSLPGRAHDLRGTALIDGLSCSQLLADRTFDVSWLRDALTSAETGAVIPPRPNRRFPAEFDRDNYRSRPLADNFFEKLNEYRGNSIRCYKTDNDFSAFVFLAALGIRLR